MRGFMLQMRSSGFALSWSNMWATLCSVHRHPSVPQPKRTTTPRLQVDSRRMHQSDTPQELDKRKDAVAPPYEAHRLRFA